MKVIDLLNKIANGEELWSFDKLFDIPHYRVREVRKEK